MARQDRATASMAGKQWHPLFAQLNQMRRAMCLAICVAALLSQGCKPFEATEQPQPAGEAKVALLQLNSLAPYTSDRCMLRDVVIGRSLYVLGAPANSGLEPGDRLLAINGVSVLGESIQAIAEALSPLPPRGAVTVAVDRRGSKTTAQVECGSSKVYYDVWRAAFQAASQAEFKRCYELVTDIDRQSPLPKDPQASALAFKCGVAAGIEKPGDNPFRDTEQWRRQIEFARWDRDALAALHPQIIAYARNLQDYGFGRLATELLQQLDHAESATNNRDSRSHGRFAGGTGTGFFVSPDGQILTSAHVVDGASRITVRLNSGQKVNAAVISSSPSMDLAVLQAETRGNDYLSVAPARSTSVGSPVFTIGYPAPDILGDEPKFTDGSLSSQSGLRGEPMFLQVSVPIQPGNSGGPLVNEAGEAIGVIAAQAALRAFLNYTGTLPQNVNWAVKAEYALSMAELPPPQPRTTNRQGAIDRARRSIVFIVAE